MSWWLPGGVTTTQCAAAYQPIGAANLAVSYVNINNPGTNNAFLGVAPNWDMLNGWTFDGLTQYLKTGITPASTNWSMFVRFSNFTGLVGQDLIGCKMGSRNFILTLDTVAFYYSNGNTLSTTPPVTSGIFGFAGLTAYRNGVNDGTIPTGDIPARTMFIGAVNDFGGANNYVSAKIQAISIYNVTLTPAQVLDLVNQMAALPPIFRGHASTFDQKQQISSIGDKKIHYVPVGDVFHTNARIGAINQHAVSTFDHRGGVS